ncbi:MAG: hypothetical protein WD733_15805 [Bryobacterales bacterium]
MPKLQTPQTATTPHQPADHPKKLNINLPSDADSDLRDLAQDVQRSKTELVAEALGLLKLIYDETRQGNRLAIISGDGKRILRELVILRLTHRRSY